MNHYPSILMSVDGDDPPEYVLMASPDSGYLSPPQEFTSMTTGIYVKKNGPFLQIIEQPVDKFRFRYKSEMAGTHGSLNGCNSDRTRKQSFPTVEVSDFLLTYVHNVIRHQVDRRYGYFCKLLVVQLHRTSNYTLYIVPTQIGTRN